MPLGRTLKNLRVARDLSREEVVDEEYSTSHLAAVEQGVKRPSIDMLDYIVDKLRVPLVKLLEEVMEHSELPTPEMLRLARKLSRDGQHTEAVKVLEEATARDDVQSGQYRANCLNTQALVYYQKGDHSKAVHLYQQLRDLRERGGNSYLISRAYYYLGIVESETENYDRASHWFFLGWNSLQDRFGGNPGYATRLLIGYANAVMCAGMSARGKELLHETLQISDESAVGRCPAIVHWGLGHCYMGVNNYEKAQTHFSKSLKLGEHLSREARADLLVDCGFALRRLGDPEEAARLLQSSVAFRGGQNAEGMLRSYCELALCHLNTEPVPWEEVYKLQKRMTPDLLQKVSDSERRLYYLVEARVANCEGNSAEAIEALNQALKCPDEFGEDNIIHRVLAFLFEFSIPENQSIPLHNRAAQILRRHRAGPSLPFTAGYHSYRESVKSLVGKMHDFSE